jgi:hypothetical protein
VARVPLGRGLKMDTALEGPILYKSSPEAGISENYCATNSGLPEVELRFFPWLILFKC